MMGVKFGENKQYAIVGEVLNIFNQKYALGTGDFFVVIGNGQTAFFVLDLAFLVEDFRVDQAQRRILILGDVEGNNALMNIDLGCRQTNALIRVHGFKHALHDVANRVVYVGDGRGFFAQARVRMV